MELVEKRDPDRILRVLPLDPGMSIAPDSEGGELAGSPNVNESLYGIPKGSELPIAFNGE
jgi:hypothetical protein